MWSAEGLLGPDDTEKNHTTDDKNNWIEYKNWERVCDNCRLFKRNLVWMKNEEYGMYNYVYIL
jgi:hypothetical protein